MSPGIIFGNRVLDVVFVAWFLAQFYKFIAATIVNGKLEMSRLWETGGMPSSHSSTVSCLTTCIALRYGLRSDIFAVTVVLAGVVMYDATGIRRAAGKQAGVLNTFVEKVPFLIGKRRYARYFGEEKREKLRELLGHTPIEVLVGSILGIVIGLSFTKYLQG